MRLRRLDLARYGKFTGRSIDFGERIAGAPDLHIVYGPNEAGKSTAFAGFLDLLFGIELQSRYGFLHPYEAMRVGGCLELSVGPRELVRIKRRSLTLLDASDTPVAESLILGDLGGLDRNAYRTMFSLDDETLEAGGKSILASNGELGQLLFSASAGLSDLSRTLIGLRAEADGFTKPHARSGELQQLKAALVDLKQERDAIDTLASDYNRLAAARDAAEAQYEAARAEQARGQAAMVRVRRLLDGLPRLAALRELRERRERLPDLPDPPPGWADELPGLMRDENRHRSATELAEAEVERLSRALEAVSVDERALALVGRLDRLAERRARHMTAELDLPNRRRERALADAAVDAILTQLGRRGEAAPAGLLLNATQSAALDRLIVTRSGVEAKLTSASDEAAEARHELAEAEHALRDASGSVAAPSLAPVLSALEALRASDHAVRLRTAAKAFGQLEQLLATRLAALAPWRGEAEALARLTVPEAASVEAWQQEIQRQEALLEQRRADLERLEGERDQRAAELDAFAASAGLVSDKEAADIRAKREAAWAEHRRLLTSASAELFEAALRRDDLVGTARLGHERDLAKLHETAQALAARRAEALRARAMWDDAAAHRQKSIDRVARAVAGIGLDLAGDWPPARLLAWIGRREKALEAWDLLRQAEWERADAEKTASALRDRLTEALRQAAVPFDPAAAPEMLAAAAQGVIDREDRIQSMRDAIEEAGRAVGRRERALQKAELTDAGWRSAWRSACAACWLGEEAARLSVEAVREMIAASSGLGAALKARAALADRIGSMEDDQASFGAELAQLAASLGIFAGTHSWTELSQAVVDRIQQAGRDEAEKRRLAAALAAARDIERQAAADAALHAGRTAEMQAHMQAGTLIDLAQKLGDAERRADLDRQAEQSERDLLTALRGGSLADAEALLDAHDRSELELEQARLAAELAELDTRTHELFAAARQASDRIAAVGGDDAAARIEQRRRTKLLEIEDKARRFLRLRVGIAAADRALRAYRDQHRSSMMEQASEAFRIISRGAYRGLGTQPDREGDILVALGGEGGSKLAAELSKGTRFQLYLALRAAGYREFAKLRPPVPFVADDIMETFDDLRAEEALRVFETMARLGQVIYLTHHDHIRAIAERTVPGVRIHDLAA